MFFLANTDENICILNDIIEIKMAISSGVLGSVIFCW